MRAEDFVLQLYEAEFGNDKKSLKSQFKSSLSKIEPDRKLFHPISSSFVRVDVASYILSNRSITTLNDIASKNIEVGTAEGFLDRLQSFEDLLESGKINLPLFETKRFLRDYKKDIYRLAPSASYKLNYRPLYKIITRGQALALPQIEAISKAMVSQLNCLVAVEGDFNGELSKALKSHFGCNVIYAKDFDEETLHQVIENILKGKSFEYKNKTIDFERLAIVSFAGTSKEFSKYFHLLFSRESVFQWRQQVLKSWQEVADLKLN